MRVLMKRTRLSPNSPTAFNNRGLAFTNRAADINPEDIE